MGKLNAKSDYEDLRTARILENQARLASLGLQKTVDDLRSITSTPKREKRKFCKKVYDLTSLRRSSRLLNSPISNSNPTHAVVRRSDRFKVRNGQSDQGTSLRRSGRLKQTKQSSSGESSEQSPESSICDGNISEEGESCASTDGRKVRPANKPFVKLESMDYQLSPEASARRCNSKGRGSVYDPIFGICCHFCRQKKLCGEEDCKRCGNLDIKQPCIGKTDCSRCHSSNGVLCRACLKVRYGEDIEDIRENKEWLCPHCVEETGSRPYWICNSSLCLKKRNMAPTGLAIFRARDKGYESVAHLLMDELQRAAKRRS